MPAAPEQTFLQLCKDPMRGSALGAGRGIEEATRPPGPATGNPPLPLLLEDRAMFGLTWKSGAAALTPLTTVAAPWRQRRAPRLATTRGLVRAPAAPAVVAALARLIYAEDA